MEENFRNFSDENGCRLNIVDFSKQARNLPYFHQHPATNLNPVLTEIKEIRTTERSTGKFCSFRFFLKNSQMEHIFIKAKTILVIIFLLPRRTF